MEKSLFDVWTNKFAENIFRQKYSRDGQESWADTSARVVHAVCGQYLSSEEQEIIYSYILDRKFIPGGRYLYASGRPFHQTNNCHAGSTRIITKNGVKNLKELCGQQIEVRNRYGAWEIASVQSFGVQALYKITFEDGRTELATANHRWWQEDGTRLTTLDLEKVPYSIAKDMPSLDEEGVRHGFMYGDGQLDTRTKRHTYVVIPNKKKEQIADFYKSETKTVTVGFGAQLKVKTHRRIKAGLKVGLQPAHYKTLPSANVSPSYARGFIAGLIASDGSTKTLDVTISCESYEKAQRIAELAVLGGCTVTRVDVISRVNPFNGRERELSEVTIWRDTAPLIRSDQIEDVSKKPIIRRNKKSLKVTKIEFSHIDETYCVVAPQSESFTLANGLITSNCFLFRAEDSREGWADIMQKITAALMTGGGIGVDYSLLRGKGAKIHKTGGESTGPLALMHMVNEAGRYIMQGGARRSAIWSGLSWQHPDIKDFIHIKDWSADIRRLKEKDFNFPAPMEGTNISVIYDTEFFIAIEDRRHPLHKLAKEIWQINCLQAFRTAEPGMSFNFLKDNESLRNAPVHGDTLILTKDGSLKVKDIVNKEVEVWTGKRWAKTTFKRTRIDDAVLELTFANGSQVLCSYDHPIIVDGWERVEAQHLCQSHVVLTGDLQTTYVIDSVDIGKHDVFCCDVGVEEHSFVANGILVSNCTEVVSEDDSDKCNLGTIWMNRFTDRDDFAKCIKYATKFLVCGGIYSDVPTEKIREVGLKNNRIGLGLGGMHEWLMQRGEGYEVTPEMHKWLSVYEMESDASAFITARELGVSKPKGVRAIAPTGCQRGDTLVVTEDGILELQELGNPQGDQWQRLNMRVAQENGVELASRFFIKGNSKTKLLKMKSGNVLECTPNHQYRCLSDGQYLWKRADELISGDKLVVALNTYQKVNEPKLIDVPKTYRTQNNCSFPTEVNKDLAFFLGVFFADGSIHNKGIRIHTNAKKEDHKVVGELGKTLFGISPTYVDNGSNCLSVYFNSITLLKWLYVNGLDKPESKNMEIPSIIRCFSRNSLEGFFDGYFFGDGSASNSARYIDTVSQKMALQTQCLLRAIGVDSSIREHVSGLGSHMYRVTFVKTKRKDETGKDTAALRGLGLNNCTVDKVSSIEDSACFTLDIEVPATTTYIANGTVSHNTIGIIAETTTGIEPLFCKAYKRRYLKGEKWHYEFVVDAAVKRLMEAGVKPEHIIDAYDISFKDRVKFQADVQNYVDMSISSTCNLPQWGSEKNNEQTVEQDSKMLLKYAKRLRGFTCYPDGSRGGQPLTRVELDEALSQEGVVFEEKEHECVGGVCGV